MLKLRLREKADAIPLEAENVRPDALASLSLAEIEAIEAFHGNRSVRLGEFFAVSGDPSDARVVIEGDCGRVKRLGVGMKSGWMRVEGNAGMHVGAEMAGGELEVLGDAADLAGAEMKGGLLRVRGDAGDSLGGVYPGSKLGMSGGTIFVEGRAGNEVGAGMRRGLVAIGGAAGDFVGGDMIAGTILVFGAVGRRPGAGMKRGSLVFFGAAPELPPTFRRDCEFEPVFLRLYLAELVRLGFEPAKKVALDGSFTRHAGDFLELGQGEILTRPTA